VGDHVALGVPAAAVWLSGAARLALG